MLQSTRSQFGVAGLRIALLLAATIGGMASCPTAGAQFVRWEIQATVVQVDEPEGVLNDVQLGDPVRGWLSFHLGIVADGTSPSISYTHPATFAVTRMMIDNPRTGGEIVFEASKDYSAYHNVDVRSDYLIAIDDVIPPPGVEADLPITAVELSSPADVFLDLRLPQRLDLADWPLATISYNDVLGGAGVYAEIYSLMPVEIDFSASDFDFDGEVAAADLQVWMLNYGTDGYPDADADLDYDADGNDFLAWQRQFDGGSSALVAAVPEPATLLLFTAAAGIHRLGGRKR